MKSLTHWNSLSALVLTGLASLSTGCGSSATSASNYLTNIQVSTTEQNGDLWASLTAQLNTGSMFLLSATIPVVDPKNPSIEYGSLSLQSNICGSTSICAGGGTLSISVDLTQVAKVQGTSNLLPNGTALPLGSAADAATIGIPLGSTGATLYVAFSNGVAILGAALPFSALNSVGQYVPGVDIFDVFTISSITGDVGIFAGSGNDQTGIAVFADLSSVINATPSSGTTTTTTSSSVTSSAKVLTAHSLVESSSSEPTQTVSFQDVKPSNGDQQTVFYELYKLSNRHARLKLN